MDNNTSLVIPITNSINNYCYLPKYPGCNDNNKFKRHLFGKPASTHPVPTKNRCHVFGFNNVDLYQHLNGIHSGHSSTCP